MAGYVPQAFVCVVLVFVAGCTSQQPGESTSAETTTSVVVTTTTESPAPPELITPEIARVEIGQALTDAIVAIDPNGDETTIEVTSRWPAGFSTIHNARDRVTGFEWRPTRAGEWDVEFTAIDSGGLSSTETVRLISRHIPVPDLMVAMGGSVAAGFGRDRSDFVRSDDCFRSERDTYAAHVHDALVSAGSLAEDSELLIVACTGASASTLSTLPVTATTVDGDAVGEPMSQLQAAVERNPTIVTLTIGAADVSLFDAAALTDPGAGNDPALAIDRFRVDNGVAHLRSHLRLTLDALVRSTDAHIVVTTWYDPTASQPIGVDGCSGDCMVAVMDEVVSAMNAAILEVVDAQPAGRVSVARLDGDADIWEAKNGLGPDALRDSFGPFQGIVDTFTGGITATCADEGGPEVDLISSLDCAHPNEAGHRAIADVVAETLLGI